MSRIIVFKAIIILALSIIIRWNRSSNKQESYYMKVEPADVRPGDTVIVKSPWMIFRGSGHAGIVSEYNSQTGSGKLIGSQGSTGVAETCLGKGCDHFDSDLIFLRVKPQYQTGEPLPLVDDLNPQHPLSNSSGNNEQTGPPQPGEKGALDFEQTGPPTPDQEPSSLTQSETGQMYADAKDYINFGSDANYVSGDSAQTGSSGNSATQDNTSAHTGNGGIISQPFTVNPALAPEGQGSQPSNSQGKTGSSADTFKSNESLNPESPKFNSDSTSKFNPQVVAGMDGIAAGLNLQLHGRR